MLIPMRPDAATREMVVSLLGSIRLGNPPQRPADPRQLRTRSAARDLEQELLGGRSRHSGDLPSLVEGKLSGLEGRGELWQQSHAVAHPHEPPPALHFDA